MKKVGDVAAEKTDDLLNGIVDAGLKKRLVSIRQHLDDDKSYEKASAQRQMDQKQQEVKGLVFQLPLWPEPARGVPNSALRGALFAAIQGKDRRYLKRELLAVQDGTQIRFVGMQLDQSDLDVWEQALHLAREHPLGTRCTFTAHAFLKALGRNTGKSDHEWLKDVFGRLASAVVEFTHKNMTYGGSLLEFYREENSQLYAIEINPKIRKLYSAGWTATDWGQRKLLRRKPLALWLHGFYSTHAEPFPMKIETLMRLSGSGTREPRYFKKALKKALIDLQNIGAIKGHEIKNGLVHVYRIPSKSQKKHISKSKFKNK